MTLFSLPSFFSEGIFRSPAMTVPGLCLTTHTAAAAKRVCPSYACYISLAKHLTKRRGAILCGVVYGSYQEKSMDSTLWHQLLACRSRQTIIECSSVCGRWSLICGGRSSSSSVFAVHWPPCISAIRKHKLRSCVDWRFLLCGRLNRLIKLGVENGPCLILIPAVCWPAGF